MRLNLGTDYGLRVLMYLLARPHERTQIEEIADAFAISSHHLTKVIQRLSRAGFIETYRGRAGGIMLARAPAEINLGDVIRSIEADFALVECFSAESNSCCLSPACRLKAIVNEALDAFIGTFERYSLADLDVSALGKLLSNHEVPADG